MLGQKVFLSIGVFLINVSRRARSRFLWQNPCEAGSGNRIVYTSRPRADRVAIAIPIKYRRAGEDHWLTSRIVNISETGVLFNSTDLAIGTPIEVIVSPPVAIGSMAPGKQVCVGEVVRITEAGAAARFDDCRFLLEP